MKKILLILFCCLWMPLFADALTGFVRVEVVWTNGSGEVESRDVTLNGWIATYDGSNWTATIATSNTGTNSSDCLSVIGTKDTDQLMVRAWTNQSIGNACIEVQDSGGTGRFYVKSNGYIQVGISGVGNPLAPFHTRHAVPTPGESTVMIFEAIAVQLGAFQWTYNNTGWMAPEYFAIDAFSDQDIMQWWDDHRIGLNTNGVAPSAEAQYAYNNSNSRFEAYENGGVRSLATDYTEAYSNHTASGSGAWEDWTLDPSVPINSIVDVMIKNSDSGFEREAGIRANGSSLARLADLQEAEAGGGSYVTMRAKVDANRKIEIYAEDNADITFTLIGLWD